MHHRRPSLASYLIWVAARLLLKPFFVFAPMNRLTYFVVDVFERLAERNRLARSVAIERVELGGRRADLIMAKGPTGGDTDTAVLYLHGGAFMSCGPGTHRSIGASLAKGLGVPVFVLDYRQLPEAGVGTAVHDGFEAYRELLGQRGFRHVVVAGDSAGGFLTVKLAELARLNDLPSPPAIALLSPLLDLDIGERADRTSRYDAYLSKRQLDVLGPMFGWGPIPFTGARRALDLDPAVFPPTIVITAEKELVEPDALELVETLDGAGQRVVLHSYPWQVHAFSVPLRHREGRESVRLVIDFLDEAITTVHHETTDRDQQTEAS